jgi:hypothetical protein
MIIVRIAILLLFLTAISEVSGQVLLDKVQANFQDVTILSVRGNFCLVDIQKGRSNDVWMDAEIRATRRNEDIKIHYNQVDSLLEVWVEQPRNVTGMLKGYLLFDIPDFVEVGVETISGNIMIQDAGKRLTVLETITGSIEAFKIRGNMVVKTVSGSIDLSEIDGMVDASSVTGSIKLTGIKKGVMVSSASGPVALAYVSGNVVVRTVSGKINAGASTGDVHLTTTGADIDMQQITGSFNVNSTSGSVKGNSLLFTGDSLFKTISGNIDIILRNKPNELSFDLQTSTGKLVLNDSTAVKQIKTSGGPVTIKGVSMLGNQFFR